MSRTLITEFVDTLSAEQFVRQKGKLSHLRRGKSIVTIAHFVNPEDSTIYYGATIFSPSPDDQHWNRKKHNELAIDRLLNAPVRIPDPFYGEMYPYRGAERNHYIRRQLPKLGCWDANNIEVDVVRLLTDSFPLRTRRI